MYVRGEGDYPPDSRVCEARSEIRHVAQVSQQLLQLRLLTPLKMSYEAAKKRAGPYMKITEELPQMRQETVQLVRQVIGAGRRAYVLVNNRSEGNAPLTVAALAGMLRGPEERTGHV